MADNTAIYTDLEDAKVDLEALQQLHKDHMIGKFDAAAIDNEDASPTSSNARIIRTTA
jgi:hypothetical protein